MTESGVTYRTDPNKADTDGNGLTDSDEAGTASTSGDKTGAYVGYSDALVADTDSDGLGDGDEADLGLDVRDRDSDKVSLSGLTRLTASMTSVLMRVLIAVSKGVVAWVSA